MIMTSYNSKEEFEKAVEKLKKDGHNISASYKLNFTENTVPIYNGDDKEDEIDEKKSGSKIECKKCGEVSSDSDWKKNRGKCPACDHPSGKPVREDDNEVRDFMDSGEKKEVDTDAVDTARKSMGDVDPKKFEDFKSQDGNYETIVDKLKTLGVVKSSALKTINGEEALVVMLKDTPSQKEYEKLKKYYKPDYDFNIYTANGLKLVVTLKENESLDEAKKEKIACVGCDKVWSLEKWKKNHGKCPSCGDFHGVAVDESLDEGSFSVGDVVEVTANELQVETVKGKDADLYRGEMFKITSLKGKYAEIKSVKPNGEFWSESNKPEFIVTSDKMGSFKKR